MNYAESLGLEPDNEAQPTTVAEVAEVVRWAHEANQAVIPWSGGTGQTYGYLPRRADILLDLSRLNRVVGHEPGDLTVTVQGGATLDAVQDALAAHNQYLPLDPPHENQATVGGILATDAFGASRLGHGTARDWLIGITVVDGQGRVVRGGGKVVKNVTGYDLPKLHVGALGTLGVIVEATFKVAPRPEAIRALMFTSEGHEFIGRLHRETAPSMSLLRETAAGRLLAVLYSGFEEAIQDEENRALSLAEAVDATQSGLPRGMPPPFTGNPPASPLAVAISGRISDVLSRHDTLREMGCWSQIDTFCGTGDSTAYLSSEADPEGVWRTLVEWALRTGIRVSVLHAPLEMRRDVARVSLWSPVPRTLPLMERLKATLDPKRILNPGRFLGGI